MITAVDSNILLDLYSGNDQQQATTMGAVRRWAAHGTLVCSPVVYAECALRFVSRAALDSFLSDIRVYPDSLHCDAAYLAGAIYHEYRKAKGPKSRILPDFLIAGHAMAQASQLLSRDRGFYRAYFRGLKVVEP